MEVVSNNFVPLTLNEMMVVDGGASEFAVAVVNIGCSIICGAVFAGIGAGVGVLAGGGVPGAIIGGVVGLVGGSVAGYYMADSITSEW